MSEPVTDDMLARLEDIAAFLDREIEADDAADVRAVVAEVKRLRSAWSDFADAIGFPDGRPRFRHEVLAHAKGVVAEIGRLTRERDEALEMSSHTFIPTKFGSDTCAVCGHDIRHKVHHQ